MTAHLQSGSRLESVPGIGKVYSNRLKSLGIHTVDDLLTYYPRTHQIYTPKTTDKLEIGEQVILTGTISKVNTNRRGRLSFQKATFQDNQGQITLHWFNQPYLARTITPGQTYQIQGTVTEFRGFKQIVQPQLSKRIKSQPNQKFVPVYPQTNGISSAWLRTKISSALENLDNIKDALPASILDKYGLLNRDTAIRQIHFPESEKAFQQAKYRLSFEELLELQLSSLKSHLAKEYLPAPIIKSKKSQLDDFLNSLQFDLTSSQSRVIDEISQDLSKSRPMNRILLGDVGTGKTVVAMAAAYITYLNGCRTLFMAPTQILSHQLYEAAKSLLTPHGVIVKLMTGKTKQKGEYDVLVGTHALLTDTNAIKDLGLVIVDEQHKFGVTQRKSLAGKSSGSAHRLTMSATPIPRSLALTLYGQTNVSKLEERPKGRKPVKTFLVGEDKRASAYDWIKKQIDEHNHQVFIVSPMIEDSDSNALAHVKSATGEYEKISKIFSRYNIDLIHGQMKEADKSKIIEKFRAKKTDVLVSTTVIEVGIDVPDANIILIESAERFGLSQLHQLRGRVGRSGSQGYCIIFPTSNSPRAQERLNLFTKIQDGEELALADMKLRGPGELFGTMQHGFFKLKIADVWDLEMLDKTKSAAQLLANQATLP